ncbi:hypothetical protein [Methylopila sp. M107]|uniref:hypothetical protein n=1 Tax=Methylopila sp. M107 TaxID=1101190 RepID=UPI0003814668|nr:hypothetical protein [Methylopila sp. M107]
MTVQNLPVGLVNYKIGALPRTNSNSIMFQGGGYSWRDKFGVFYNHGPSSENARLYHTYTSDGGLNWEGPFLESNGPTETDPQKLPYLPTYACHWNIVRENRMFVLIKGDNDLEDGVDATYRLFGKAIKRFEVKRVSVSVTQNSNVMTINWPEHGLKGSGGPTGDKVNISKFLDDSDNTGIGGVSFANITGDRGANVSTGDKFTITMGANATAAGVTTKDVILGLTVVPSGWREVTYNPGGTQVAWETALMAQTGLASVGMCQHIVSTASGKWVTGLSGNYKAVLRVPDPIRGDYPDFALGAAFARCTGDGPGTPKYLSEPSLATVPGGETVFGFLRTQGKPYQYYPEFFWSPDAGATVYQSAISDTIAARCPIACGLGDDGFIYGFAMERLTQYTGDADRRPAYLLRAPMANALAAPAAGKCGAAFTVYKVGEVELLSQAQNLRPVDGRSGEASNTGRPVCIKHGSWLVFLYEEQELGCWQNSEGEATVKNGWSNIKYFAVDTRPRATAGDFPLTRKGVLV